MNKVAARRGNEQVGEAQLYARPAVNELVAVPNRCPGVTCESFALASREREEESFELGHAMTIPLGTTRRNTPRHLSRNTRRYTLRVMDDYERRQALLRLLIEHFAGGVKREFVARINRDESYVGRLLYAREKRGAKGIGTAIMDACRTALDLPDGYWDSNVTAASALLSGGFSQVGTNHTANVEPGPDLHAAVPLISWIHAGAPAPAGDPYPPGVAETWLPCPRPHSQGAYALRVRGDSMTAPYAGTRTYPEGCLIFVDPALRSPSNGDRVIARVDDSKEFTFKVYKNEDGRQWLQPLNPAHEPIREPFAVLGTVIGKWEDE